jgi:uncharacterized protein
MVKRKRAPKKKPAPKRKTRPKKQPPVQVFRIVAGVAILLALVVAGGYWAHQRLRTAPSPDRIAEPPAAPLRSKTVPPAYEVYSAETEKAPKRPPANKAPKTRPEVAIIIDDLGYDRAMANKFIEMNTVLTISVLPDSPFLKSIVAAANQKGYEILLHLPMEPDEYPRIQPGPGALLMEMSPDELIAQLYHDLGQVPHLIGVNNHMGSRMTKDPPKLRQVFSVLKKEGLFFIDSRTTAETQCEPSARLLQVPFAERDVFIDHSTDPEFIRRQIKRLINRAKRQGYAIGIGHPHLITFQILQEALPELEKEVDLVPVSRVVKIPS